MSLAVDWRRRNGEHKKKPWMTLMNPAFRRGLDGLRVERKESVANNHGIYAEAHPQLETAPEDGDA